MGERSLTLVALAVLALSIAALLALHRQTVPLPRAPAVGEPRPTRAPARRPPSLPSVAPSVAPSAPVPHAPRPASLDGTTVDGELDLDGDGRFVATPRALRLFDYFLATLGEADVAGIRALVAAEASRRVPGQEEAVLALFDQYVGYLGEMDAAARTAGPRLTPREYLALAEDVQRAAFGADAEALFGDERALATAILDRSEVLARHDLSPGEMARALEAIEARLPVPVREARARARAPAQVRDEVAALRRRGASSEEIDAVRAAHLGADAAARLAELDRQRGVR